MAPIFDNLSQITYEILILSMRGKHDSKTEISSIETLYMLLIILYKLVLI
jgi:hypothetical protein